MSATTAAPAKPRTTRITDTWAGPGAVAQHGGNLPVYRCNGCGREVAWAKSKAGGRAYLVSVSRGYRDQRYYRGNALHPRDCAQQAQAETDRLELRERVTEIQRRQASEMLEMRRRGATDTEFLAVIDRYDIELAAASSQA